MHLSRRTMLLGSLLVSALPAQATPDSLQAAIAAFTGARKPAEGPVRIEISPLVENGNTVPVTVVVDSPMTAADHVVAIGLFNERNPHSEVATFALGPHNGLARVSTRMRLATSQKVVAVARLSDGRCWQHTVDVVVTLAACVEG